MRGLLNEIDLQGYAVRDGMPIDYLTKSARVQGLVWFYCSRNDTTVYAASIQTAARVARSI